MAEEKLAEEAAKPKAERRPKKPKVSPKIYKFYSISQSGKIERLRRECPRCGRGVFMAQHKDRLHCGKCGYTEWVKKS